jgi:poly-gamma-glutamate synthesis protein (capsule biosynthesis protein)
MPTILIGADVCPIEGNRPFFMKGDAASLFHDLLPEMQAADLVLANLESPLIERPSAIPKTGPIFGEHPDCIRGIQAAGIQVLGLANNHILDHGPQGLRSTLQACRSAGIATVGAGPNLAAASQMLIREVGGLRVGILAYAENEFSIAGSDTWGANPIDIPGFVRTLRANQGRFDHLIVMLHGSAEFHAPTPRVQDLCRFMIEMGAHTVLVQHPHVLGGCESYQGGYIVYGQGALIMDEAIYRFRRSFHLGFLLKLTLYPNAPARHEWVPFEQSAPAPGARKLRGEAERQFRNDLESRSKSISDPAYVKAEWLRFCSRLERSYVSSVLGFGGVMRRLDSSGLVEKFLYGPRRMAGVRNIVCCETHREAIGTILDLRRAPALIAASREADQAECKAATASR